MKYLWLRITLYTLLPMLFFAQAPDGVWTKTYDGTPYSEITNESINTRLMWFDSLNIRFTGN